MPGKRLDVTQTYARARAQARALAHVCASECKALQVSKTAVGRLMWLSRPHCGRVNWPRGYCVNISLCCVCSVLWMWCMCDADEFFDLNDDDDATPEQSAP